MSRVIVKVGGSLFGAQHLDGVLAAAAQRGAIVVPGGGRFADAVREAQDALGFDDGAAHRMAILAMEQAAHMIAARRPDLIPCATQADFDDARRRALPALWMPAAMALAADVPASWNVTSDSFALWLGIELGAAHVVLAKSAAPRPGSTVADWATDGLVDPFVPALAARFSGDVACVDASDLTALDAALDATSAVRDVRAA